MAVVGLAVAACLVLGLCAFPETKQFTRRGFTRLALWGAVGLSFLPGCRKGGPQAHPSLETADPSLVEKWARVGRLWRELNSLSTKSPKGSKRSKRSIDEVGADLDSALADLPAWPELKELVFYRKTHINCDETDEPPSCYVWSGGGPPERQGQDVSEPINELRNLVAEGKLTRRTAKKAAARMASVAELGHRARRERDEDGDVPRGAWRGIAAEYESGTLEASPPSTLAGERIVEITVDNLGWLAGTPRRDEGMPPETEEEPPAEH